MPTWPRSPSTTSPPDRRLAPGGRPSHCKPKLVLGAGASLLHAQGSASPWALTRWPGLFVETSE